MAWNNIQFDDALRKKYQIQQQGANADTTRADATMESVQQQPGLQEANNAAAMERARLASATTLQSQAMQNQGASNVAGINAQSRTNVANIGEQGANYRTRVTTGTQRDIAGMENQLGRDRLAQQGQQFGQQFGLDTAKAQESAIQGRAALGVNEYGTPSFNPKSGAMESAVKRPAITNLAPSPLSTVGGGNGLGMESDDTLRKIRAQLAQNQGQ